MSKILIVEDFDTLRQLLSDVIGFAGYEIESATSGLEAIESLQQTDFKLVVTDLIMPECDGIKLTEWIRAHQPDLKVIAISGGKASIPGVYLQAAKAAGADVTLEKPFSNAQLLDAIKQLLD